MRFVEVVLFEEVKLLSLFKLILSINKIKNQIKIVKYALENVINENEKNLKEIKNSFKNNNIKNNDNDNEKFDFLMKQLKIKDNEINALKSKTASNLNPEELISVMFKTLDGKVDYSIVCKKTDIFNMIENKFYAEFPEYRETENYFLYNGYRINEAKTIEENNIRNSGVILLYQIEEDWLLYIEDFIHTLSKLNN